MNTHKRFRPFFTGISNRKISHAIFNSINNNESNYPNRIENLPSDNLRRNLTQFNFLSLLRISLKCICAVMLRLLYNCSHVAFTQPMRAFHSVDSLTRHHLTIRSIDFVPSPAKKTFPHELRLDLINFNLYRMLYGVWHIAKVSG